MFSRRKYNVNQFYFEEIDSPDKAYFLGWLASDGHINTKRNEISIALQEGDKEILEKLNKFIENEKPLTKIVYNKLGQENWKDQYKLIVNSKKMTKDLEKILVCDNKSKKIVMPNIPDVFMNEFMKGVLEGDGNIYFSLTKKGYLQTSLSFYSASESFSDSIISTIKENCGVTLIKRLNKFSVFVLTTGGFLNLEKILNWIYFNKEDRFLKRKYEKWCEINKIRDEKRIILNERANRKCSIEGCGRKHTGRGLCSKHHWKYWSQGDPLFISEREKKMNTKIPVIQYGLDGCLIKKWECFKLAGRTLGIDQWHINSACKNRSGSCGNFQWRFESDDIDSLIPYFHEGHKSILKINVESGEETSFPSIKSISDEEGLSVYLIKNYIKNGVVNNGFILKFATK
jgi:hypothetical protein